MTLPSFPKASVYHNRREYINLKWDVKCCLTHLGSPIWKRVLFWDAEITWTYVQEAHMRCHPTGGGTNPVSASSGPGNALMQEKDQLDVLFLQFTLQMIMALLEWNSPINPILRPRTKIPFSAPISTNSSASSLEPVQHSCEKQYSTVCLLLQRKDNVLLASEVSV